MDALLASSIHLDEEAGSRSVSRSHCAAPEAARASGQPPDRLVNEDDAKGCRALRLFGNMSGTPVARRSKDISIPKVERNVKNGTVQPSSPHRGREGPCLYREGRQKGPSGVLPGRSGKLGGFAGIPSFLHFLLVCPAATMQLTRPMLFCKQAGARDLRSHARSPRPVPASGGNHESKPCRDFRNRPAQRV